MARLFWPAIFLAAAVCTHLAYILYGPQWQMGRLLLRTEAIAGVNRMALLDAGERERLFGAAASAAAIAVCPLRIAGEPVALSAVFPDEFWFFAIYSAKGRPVYALDERLAGQRSFVLTIGKSAGLDALINPAPPDPAAAESWKAELPGAEGLAVLWAAVPAPYLRQRIEATLIRSRCGV